MSLGYGHLLGLVHLLDSNLRNSFGFGQVLRKRGGDELGVASLLS